MENNYTNTNPYLDDNFEYTKFKQEMVKTHTILIPSMLDIHMSLFEGVLLQSIGAVLV